MPKRKDIEKILIIGSGPIIIGQACEFDYSGTQALKALRKEGYKVVLVNSNPATIMTDPEFADATYIEPLTPETLEAVIEKEKPQVLLPTLGGQTALNLAVALAQSGALERHKVELIGAKLDAIRKAEDRRLFKKTMQEIGLDLPRSGYVTNLSEAEDVARSVGFPLIVRPSFTLGGTGSSIVYSRDEFVKAAEMGLKLSPVWEILVEEYLEGWKEFELEVMRDSSDHCVVICPIENFDPMGIHTGDSITVAPAMTLTDKEYQKMREAAFACIRAIGVDTGGSNIQFALHPQTGRLVVIEMNPRVSRSSALASKATGFPIAKIAALLAVGYRLDEIPNDITKKTPACFEPSIDYVVVKVPRFNFEKFAGAEETLGSAMKSVGEVMSIGSTFKEALQKALRGLETGRHGLGADGTNASSRVIEEAVSQRAELAPDQWEARFKDVRNSLKERIRVANPSRIFAMADALRLGLPIEEVSSLSKVDPWFVRQIEEIIQMERHLLEEAPTWLATKSKEVVRQRLLDAKKAGFSDVQLGHILRKPPIEIRALRQKLRIQPVYKIVDTCAAEFEAHTPYFYSTYQEEDEKFSNKGKKIMILGGGPNRIGQGIEFDYCCVHAVLALKKNGYQTIMVNCNPETVSTDYDTADQLYFEPLTLEDVLHIAEREKPLGAIVQFGGQTPLNLAIPLEQAGVRILGTSPDSIDLAEDRGRFGRLLDKLGIPQAAHGVARSFEEAKAVAQQIGYPVMLRPSYVLGGRAMEVAYDEEMLASYIARATAVSPDHPVLIDKFLDNALELDVDALSDGKDTHIGGIMEHIEAAGIHSGDSACLIPSRSLKKENLETIGRYTRTLAQALKVKGLMNIQLAMKDDVIYILEVNPRASRTVPFVSKATGVPLAKTAALLMIGKRLKDVLPANILKDGAQVDWVSVKEAVLPWARFPGVDAVLGPEMRSTGEVMGIGRTFAEAFAKSQSAAGAPLPQKGAVLISVRDEDKGLATKVAKKLVEMGFHIFATNKTAQTFQAANINVTRVNKIEEGRPHVVDFITNRQVTLVINTPSGKKARSDGHAIRTAALTSNVPIITTPHAALAALEGIKNLQQERWIIRPLQGYYHFIKEARGSRSKTEQPIQSN